MTAKIKICGIATRAALEAARAARADHVGLVFYPPSPRHLTSVQAAGLAQADPQADRIGLFVDADDAVIGEAAAAGRLAAVQLHGSETPERVAQIRARFGRPAWKALPVASAADVARADAYAGAADLILFDARTPTGTLPGGMGLAFDWSLLASYRGALPWGLAGGLDPGNVGRAIRVTGASLVDTSSGVESAPGVKDVDLIRAFCQAARSA